MSFYLGIDPGLSGAIAAIGPLGEHVWDIPTVLVDGKKSSRRAIDLIVLSEIFKSDHCQRISLAVLEKVHAMPEQGVTSSFAFGEGFGVLKGMLGYAGIPYSLVAPQTWKGVMLRDGSKDKGAAVVAARSLFPKAQLIPDGCRVARDGRAEALLMAEYARRVHVGSRVPTKASTNC